MKVRDLIGELLKDGWYLHSQEGSHRHFKHPIKPWKVTVSYRDGDEIPTWYANKIRKQAGLP
jgi:predicted RNA binding protein YcfA (HicA-like mRNA interferase family)